MVASVLRLNSAELSTVRLATLSMLDALCRVGLPRRNCLAGFVKLDLPVWDYQAALAVMTTQAWI